MILYLFIGALISVFCAETVKYDKVIELSNNDRFLAMCMLTIIAMAWPVFLVVLVYMAKNKS